MQFFLAHSQGLSIYMRLRTSPFHMCSIQHIFNIRLETLISKNSRRLIVWLLIPTNRAKLNKHCICKSVFRGYSKTLITSKVLCFMNDYLCHFNSSSNQVWVQLIYPTSIYTVILPSMVLPYIDVGTLIGGSAYDSDLCILLFILRPKASPPYYLLRVTGYLGNYLLSLLRRQHV